MKKSNFINLSNLSIRKRLFLAMFVMLFIQFLSLTLGILKGGLVEKLKDEFLSIFDAKILSRKNYIEDNIQRYYTSLYEYENFIQKQVDEHEGAINNTFLENISEKAVSCLRQSGVTGIYVIFDNDGSKEGFYIRDLEPSVVANDNSDLLFLNGPVSVARKIKLSLDREWSSDFKLDASNPAAGFYFRPVEAARRYKGSKYQDLGCWNRPVQLSPNDVEVVTYSVPLLDREGQPYGVVGIDLTIDHVKSLMPYNELMENQQGAYMLGLRAAGENNYERVLSTGPIFNRMLDFEDELKFTREEEKKEIYRINKNIYFSAHKIDLYNKDNPHSADEWYLAGLIEDKKLFLPINQLLWHALLILPAWLLMGIIGIVVLGNWFVRPVTKLVKQLLEKDPNERIVLDETNIVELNELAAAIEIMSEKVVDSFSKLSQIVGMINIPLGAFEYIHGEDYVYITEGVCNILKVYAEESKPNYIAAGKFNALIAKIREQPEKDTDNVFLYESPGLKARWLRIRMREEDYRTLGIIEDISDEMIRRRRLEYERDLDPLTKLLNRRGFTAKVKEKMKNGLMGTAALIIWDLDNLKYINDAFGHDYGDQYIKLAAKVLKESTIYNSLVARMSGDEFCVFLYGYVDKERVRRIIDGIQEKIKSAYLVINDENKIRLRASAGVAWYPEDSSLFEELFRYADFTMYQIKTSNKGTIAEFDKDIYLRDSILLQGKEELNNLIDNELVDYVFQPIVDAEGGEVFAYEALMRPQVGLIKSPLDFIRLAQSQARLYDVERITFFKAMEAYVEKAEMFGQAKIFINSIPNHALNTDDLELFEEKFKEHLHRIVVEVTESEQSDENRTRVKRENVARWGGKLALDDFGSGYNSEITLLLLSPDYIKVDMGIIRDIDKDEDRQKLFLNILSYTKPRNIKVIAEGVETKRELEVLRELGVDYVQGYYIGKPKPSP